MKLLVGAALLLTSAAANAGFVHPLDFDGSEAQKKEVISYIQKRVKADYCDGQLDMCQPTTLRMMEKQNLNAFKKLTKVTDRQVLDRVIKDYCQGTLDMCSYTTLEMMYKQNAKATKQELSW
ncbi:hypothetical protein C3408_05580 [Candidatus Pantoea alvi]|uniref:hypothetical protein n=1 Tax=Enterobacter agglomerans TaxID=549 RepID=UPI000CDD6FA5|nr:hypothetical protein [Pantoea agglomerans]POW59040.1 hypothetical protein C3408_05580 [Pantoea alvi]UBN54935.1 hypothetical protein LB453_05005 [Pantoea agglomerans]